MPVEQNAIIKNEEAIKNKLLIFQAWAEKIPHNKTIAKQIKYLFSLAQNIVAKRSLIVLSPSSNQAICYFVSKQKLWRLPICLPRPLLPTAPNLPQLYKQSRTNNNNTLQNLPGGAGDEIWTQLIKEGKKLKVNGKPILKLMEKIYYLLLAYRPEINRQKMPLIVGRHTYRTLQTHERTILDFLAQIITHRFAPQNGWYSISAYGEIIYPFVLLKTKNKQPKLYFFHSASFDPGFFWTVEITVQTFFTNLAYHFFS